jgi:hypothetical protein
MMYQFHGVEHTSKIMSNWDANSNMDFGHVNIDEFRKRFLVKPQIDENLRIKKSGLDKESSFPPTLVSLELAMACQEC